MGSLFYCTSLAIKDKDNQVYHGRTMEFSTEAIPSFVAYFPVGSSFKHFTPKKEIGLSYEAKYALLGVALPMPGNGIGLDYELCEGVNSGGLSFSLNMKSDCNLPPLQDKDAAIGLPFDAFGHWALANFSTIEEIKTGVKQVVVWSRALEQVGGIESPFHFAFYDTTGACLVVEASGGELHLYDNPTGVMTNGPEFPWHLTNLNNYTHLTNIDKSSGVLGNIAIKQPDTGIATATLPSSDTSVDRFVRAVFYSTYVEKVSGAAQAIIELSHIMNKFDRPKNMTVSGYGEGGENNTGDLISEFTVWTSLTDLKGGVFSVRGYHSLNYTTYTLDQFK